MNPQELFKTMIFNSLLSETLAKSTKLLMRGVVNLINFSFLTLGQICIRQVLLLELRVDKKYFVLQKLGL
jgi:hypothetical protein